MIYSPENLTHGADFQTGYCQITQPTHKNISLLEYTQFFSLQKFALHFFIRDDISNG